MHHTLAQTVLRRVAVKIFYEPMNLSCSANVSCTISASGLESPLHHQRGRPMKKFTWTSIALLFSAAAGFAQVPCACSSPLTDQEHFVREEIESRINESIEAAEAKDLAAQMHYAAPDLTVTLVDGTVLDRKQLEEGLKRDSDWTLSVSDQTTIKL